jgi:5-formyltetrahydrofolate cyclo-ligase
MKIVSSNKLLKSRLRKEIRQKRARLDEGLRVQMDAAINRQLVEYVDRRSPAVIAAFLTFDGEPDLEPALRQLENSGKMLAVPVVKDTPGKSIIEFREWSGDCDLQNNRYGIPEPVGTRQIRTTDIDLVLVPLVAWDDSGGRLGMGASFYDRHFQSFSGSDRPLRVGVAYELQKVEKLPLDPWDIRLHAMLSERGWFTYAS